MDIIKVLFDDLRVTAFLFFLIIIFAAFFSSLYQTVETLPNNEKVEENIEIVESSSINGILLIIAIGGIGTVIAIILWFGGVLNKR